MELPDISTLDQNELSELISLAQQHYANLEHTEREDTKTRKVEAEQALVLLKSLLGEEGATPSMSSIRGVRSLLAGMTELTPEQAYQGMNLAFIAMEQMTKALVDVTTVVVRT